MARKKTEPKAPRKPRAAKPAAAAAQQQAAAPAPPSPEFEGKRPEPDQVRRLVKQLETLSEDQKSIGGTAREKIAKAVEGQHFDAKALSWARSLFRFAKKKPNEFAISFVHFMGYVDDLGLPEIADKARGLPINGEEQAETTAESPPSAPAAGDQSPSGGSKVLRVVPKDGEQVPSPEAAVG